MSLRVDASVATMGFVSRDLGNSQQKKKGKKKKKQLSCCIFSGPCRRKAAYSDQASASAATRAIKLQVLHEIICL